MDRDCAQEASKNTRDPIEDRRSPTSRALTAMRVTAGTLLESGRSFRRIDSWTQRTTAHEGLKEPWVGKTWFALRSDTVSEPAEVSQRSLRAPACYGERPLRGSEQRSVLGTGCQTEAAGCETGFQFGPTPTRGTGPVMHGRLDAICARHLPRQRVHVKRHTQE